MKKDNFIVVGLGFLLIFSTILNVSNAEAFKIKDLPAKVAKSNHLSKTQILQKYKNAKSLTPKECKELLQAVGFSGKNLRMAWAVAQKESSCRPMAWNKNAKTGDNSYGIFQINMIGSLGQERLQQFSLNSKSQLFDPVKNAQIAFHMSKKGINWSSWTNLHSSKFKENWIAYSNLKSN